MVSLAVVCFNKRLTQVFLFNIGSVNFCDEAKAAQTIDQICKYENKRGIDLIFALCIEIILCAQFVLFEKNVNKHCLFTTSYLLYPVSVYVSDFFFFFFRFLFRVQHLHILHTLRSTCFILFSRFKAKEIGTKTDHLTNTAKYDKIDNQKKKEEKKNEGGRAHY